jgi:hypothetical protein
MKSTTPETIDPQSARVRRTFAQACLGSCRKLLTQIQSTKAAILAEFRETLEEHSHLLDLAVNEAEALAWQTGFPQLVFPTLAAEKARAVADWHAHQQSLHDRTQRRLSH